MSGYSQWLDETVCVMTKTGAREPLFNRDQGQNVKFYQMPISNPILRTLHENSRILLEDRDLLEYCIFGVKAK